MKKRKRSQYQWLWAKEACSLYYMVNKATEEVKPLHLPTSRAERQSAWAAECSLRAEPQTPPVKGKREREEESGYHLFLFYLLSSSMWKMIFTVSYLQSWIPCYFIPEQRHNREGLLFHAGGPSVLFKGAVYAGEGLRGTQREEVDEEDEEDEEGGGHRQMHANLGNGVTFQRLLSLATPCKDSVN